MIRKSLIVVVVFVLVGAAVLGVSWAAAPQTVRLPEKITETTLCPVAGCTQPAQAAKPDGGCHASAPAPVPDGSFTMLCPVRTTCADTTCHAWDRIDEPRSKPSDASLNLWVIAPVALALILVWVARKL